MASTKRIVLYTILFFVSLGIVSYLRKDYYVIPAGCSSYAIVLCVAWLKSKNPEFLRGTDRGSTFLRAACLLVALLFILIGIAGLLIK